MEKQPETHRLLLVEDDLALAQMVRDFMSSHGFQVDIESRGDRAAERIPREQPDIVLLDVNLPGMDGFSVCRQVRAGFSGAIIMLTARHDEMDEVVGLEVGADDYVTKPIRPRALLARLRAHLRRESPQERNAPSEPIRVGALVVDPSSWSAELNGKPLDLTTAEFELLKVLAENAGHALKRTDIYQQIHGLPHDGLDRSIDLRISRLRKKLGDDPAQPQRIKSVRGVGYILSIET